MADRGFPIHSLTAVLDSAYAGAVMTGMQWSLGPDGKVLAYPGTGGGGGGTLPTGTGFRHITGGVEDAASQLVSNADVAVGAAIVESKLSLNWATHSNANDPAADEKAALAGTSGTPSAANKYVTDADARLGGGSTWTEAEVDFLTPSYDYQFTVTDAAVGATSKVTVIPCGKAATGRTADDWQWDGISFAALPAVGSFTLYAVAHPGPVVGKRKIQYSVAS